MQIANPIYDVVFKNELEQLLSIFDQSNRTSDDHILNVKEEDFPEKQRDLIRRLQKAATEPEIRKKMDVEDEIIEELAEREREAEERIAEKELIIEEQGKVIQEKDKTIEDLMRELEEFRKQAKK